jgi:hypothetical protein
VLVFPVLGLALLRGGAEAAPPDAPREAAPEPAALMAM